MKLGFDIIIPSFVKENMRTLGYAEQIMVLLYYKGSPMSRSDLHKRDSILFIKDSWWNGSNFTIDLDKKISEKFITKTNDKYKLSQSGVSFIRKNILEDKN